MWNENNGKNTWEKVSMTLHTKSEEIADKDL